MPGPSNRKKKQKSKGKQKNQKQACGISLGEGRDDLPSVQVRPILDSPIPRTVEQVILQPPFIHDPGNGPRVRDAKLFMKSFFAQPVALDDPLCREFAQDEVLEMLMTVLPEETALILWYNKSRLKSRICPACQRLYQIGDVLADLTEGKETITMLAEQLREQELSGLCSPVCFVMASFDFPGAIKSAWGHTGDEIGDDAWDVLNSGESRHTNGTQHTLGMLVKMTRLYDLGLSQLCF